MFLYFKRHKIISYILIIQLLGLPVPVIAKTTQETTNLVGGAESTGLTLAVVPVANKETDIESLQKIADTVRDELLLKEKYQVISRNKTDAFFKDNPDFLKHQKAPETLNRYIDEAKQFYIDFAYKESIGLLHNTIEAFEKTESLQRQVFALRDAHVVLANVYAGANDKKKAVQVFREAVRLDPTYEIDPIVYPPKTVECFKEAKELFSKNHQPVTLEITSSPNDADIYINGVHKGSSPLRLENFSQGEHYIVVKKGEFETLGLKILISNNFKEKVHLKKKIQPELDLYGLKVANIRDIPELVRLGSIVGEGLGVQKLVLVSLEEIGWNHRVTTRMIDIKYRASHKHKSVEVLDLPKDSRTAAKLLAEDLNKMSDIDLAKDPEKYAESDVVVIGTKRKKSLLKNPLLWSLLGVLVAGGATSAVLLTRGGDDAAPEENPNGSVGFGGGIGKF
ncbi:MAG: PEGA domain-containing protein [Deltaproteobacteria bacterium]|nr:PEGA domain-containing protein [Deltaproteobacteria bacterium]